MKRIVHITTQWPTLYQTFVIADISVSREFFDSVVVFGPFLRSKYHDFVTKKPSIVKSSLSIVSRFGRFRFREINVIRIIAINRGFLKTVYILLSACRIVHYAEISKYPSDVTIHSHFFYNSTDIAIVIKLLFPEISFIATGHGSDVFFNSPDMVTLVIAWADYVVCASRAVETSIKKMLEVDNIPVNSVIVRYCRTSSTNQSGINSNTFIKQPVRIITVGRMTYQKGWDLACKTASLLVSAGIKFEWIFIGDGELMEDVRSLCNSLGLKDEIVFMGALSHKEVISNISSSNFMVCPAVVHNNESDGLPVVILEAMSMSKVVISNEVGGIAEALGGGRGLLVLPTPESFKNSIVSLINGSINGESISQKAKSWIEENCSFGVNDPLASVYEICVERSDREIL